MKFPEQVYTEEYKKWELTKHYVGLWIDRNLKLPLIDTRLKPGYNLLELEKPNRFAWEILRRAITHEIPENASNRRDVFMFCADLFDITPKTPADQVMDHFHKLSDEEKARIVKMLKNP